MHINLENKNILVTGVSRCIGAAIARRLDPLIVLLVSGMAKHATGTTIDVNAGSYMH